MTSNDVTIFLDGHAALIVVGGTLSASFICFSFGRVFGMVKVFWRRMLGKSKRDYLGLVQEIVALSTEARKGRSQLEAFVPKVRDNFLRDAAGVLSWAEADVPTERLRTLLETRAETHIERYLEEAQIFKSMAKFPPAFGLMGTTLGMIVLLRSLGSADSKNLIGPAMAVALVATLYGIVLANFIFTPIAENLTKQSKEDLVARRMVIEGVMLIAADMPTRFIEEQVLSFLLPSERGPGRAGPGTSGGAGSGPLRKAA
jgi:chemotaxis protein MotA